MRGLGRELPAIQELVSDQHALRWPVQFKTGIFGLNAAQLAKLNSDSIRVRLGLGATRWTFFKSLFSRES